ncbi:phospholipase D-like domain-containing protein [Desulfosporosinus fructosivorans]
MSKLRFIVSIFLLIFSMLSLSGCSLKFPNFSSEPAPISNLPPEALYVDKEAIYARTLSLIQSAQTSVYVEQAEFDDPQLIQLLLVKSQAGVEVRVLLDQWQKVNRTTLDQLKSQNVSIQYYPAQKGQINHTKYLIVDQKVAMVYGPPWTADGLLAHDLAVELSGRSAWKAATVFSKDWEFTTTSPLSVPKTSTLPDDYIVLATNAKVKEQLAEKISASITSIWIEISEISDPDLIQALVDAAAKGRDVRLILDRAVMSKSPVSLEKLTASNISIRYFPTETPLGMHLAIFDNSTFFLSSANWTRASFVTNHEFSITVPSPSASIKLGNLFMQDWEKITK